MSVSRNFRIVVLGLVAGVVGILGSLSLPGVAAAQDAEDSTYVVEAGDTLRGIASRFDSTVAQIAQANRIADPDVIHVGQELSVPEPTEGSDTQAPAPSPDTYTVQSGDTLYGIASRFGTTVTSLAESNAIADVDRIAVGLTLIIPGAGEDGGEPSTDDGDDGQGGSFALQPVDATGRSGSGIVEDVRIGEHDGYDRIVFEFANDYDGTLTLSEGVPSYRVEYVDSAAECGSGFAVDTQGDAMLRVHFPDAYVYDPETGEATVDSLELTADHQVILEADEMCGFEGQSTWVLGVSSGQPFRVSELSSPARLVVDVMTE